jgi:methylthioribose-1-phosphate isomerase
MIRTIEWTDQGVVMIDQRLLPTEEIYNTYETVEEVAEAIQTMVIRGAPAIGVATAMGIALGVKNLDSEEALDSNFADICETLRRTRPTARNLFWAIERMTALFEANRHLPLNELQSILQREAVEIHRDDVEINRRMGENGARLLEKESTVLTHCNAGALATAGFGTALGVIRAAVEDGKAIHVFADETRPFLQGARLTAWEMQKEDIPCTLITDNMSGHFMKLGRINAVVVGADRIARNGDVANKIGTYTVAVLAKEHGIPFYVAAPLSTIDMNTPTGADIPIEQRDTAEITEINGKRIAPESTGVENPAFDVTPNRFVTAIITEVGVATAPFDKAFVEQYQIGSP